MNHHCHAEGCKKRVPPAMFACRDHWFKLSKADRDKLWSLYRPGQEITKDPSMEYVEHALHCVEVLARQEGLRV